MSIRVGINTAARQRLRADRINSERDRRIGAGFHFLGQLFQFDPASKSRITGAATLAGFAIGAGAITGDLRWNGGAADFAWIAADNARVPMDAQTCFAFGQAAAEHERAHVFAALALKALVPIPPDFAADHWWPAPAV